MRLLRLVVALILVLAGILVVLVIAKNVSATTLDEGMKPPKIIRLRDFPTLSALNHWLAFDDTSEHIRLRADPITGEIVFNGNCEDRALQLIYRAEELGYRLHFYPMARAEYYQHYRKVLPRGYEHIVCLVVIGNEVYLIDPKTDEVWLRGYLD